VCSISAVTPSCVRTRKVTSTAAGQTGESAALLNRRGQAGAKVESQGGIGLDLSPDLHLFHKARNSATATLELPEAKGPESLRRDAVDQCLFFLSTLEGLVPESQANDLARLALKAHGYADVALTDLDEDKIRSGKVRKRKDALRKRCEDALVKVKSYGLRQ